jgi:hypothetical protein
MAAMFAVLPSDLPDLTSASAILSLEEVGPLSIINSRLEKVQIDGGTWLKANRLTYVR